MTSTGSDAVVSPDLSTSAVGMSESPLARPDGDSPPANAEIGHGADEAALPDEPPTTSAPRKPIPRPAGVADDVTEEEIEEYSRIRCCVCGANIAPEEVAAHSRECVLEPAPNLRLQLDKWCIASVNMTPAEQRNFIHMRRTEELARVEELEARLAGRMTQLWWMSGRFGYIISSKWLRQWRSFVGLGQPTAESRERPPGPINNNDLFSLEGSIRTELREGVKYDYELMEQPVWDLLVQVYGGGPAILRYNTSGAPPALTDESGSFEGDWKDLRPDTGCGKVFDPYSACGFDGEIRDGFLWTCMGKGLLRSGSHFEGRVENGLPDGAGREVRVDGTILEGNFSKGVLHGQGRLTPPNGELQEGEWEQGELNGI